MDRYTNLPVERKLGPTLLLALVLMALALLAPGCTAQIRANNGPSGVECVTVGAPWHRPCPCPSTDGLVP